MEPISITALPGYIGLVEYHAIFSYIIFLPILLNIYRLFTYQNLVILNKKIWFSMPIIFFLITVGLLSGISILAMSKELKLSVIFMIVFTLLVLVLEIVRIRYLKVARRTNQDMMDRYVRFCRIIYIAELLLFTMLTLYISYLAK